MFSQSSIPATRRRQKHSVVAVYHAVSVNVGVLQIEIIIDKAGSVAKDQNRIISVYNAVHVHIANLKDLPREGAVQIGSARCAAQFCMSATTPT